MPGEECEVLGYDPLQFFFPAVSSSPVASASYHTGDLVPVLFNVGKNTSGTLIIDLYLQSVDISNPYADFGRYGRNMTILSMASPRSLLV